MRHTCTCSPPNRLHRNERDCERFIAQQEQADADARADEDRSHGRRVLNWQERIADEVAQPSQGEL